MIRVTLVALAATLLLGAPMPAAATPPPTAGCVTLGTVNDLAQAGRPTTIDPTNPATFPTSLCRARGFRSFRAYADTPTEADRLAEVARWSRGDGFVAVYCRAGDRARYMAPAQMWVGGVDHMTRREVAHWNRYARGWAQRRGCEVTR